jgi:hypothetical protein
MKCGTDESEEEEEEVFAAASESEGEVESSTYHHPCAVRAPALQLRPTLTFCLCPPSSSDAATMSGLPSDTLSRIEKNELPSDVLKDVPAYLSGMLAGFRR